VRLEHIVPGRRPPDRLEGAVLARDLVVGGERWSKGRRLTAADLEAWTRSSPSRPARAGSDVVSGAVTVLILEPGDLHEDDAALRLATAVGGSGLVQRGPGESRVDLLAATDGVLHVRVRELELVNRIDPLEVFTALDGSVVAAGQLVASVKVAPHVVPEAVVDAGIRRAGGGARALVWVAPFVAQRVGVLVKESIRAENRARFERSARDKVESLGSSVTGFDYVPDVVDAVVRAMRRLTRGSTSIDILLTAGGRSTDPGDPFFVALEQVGGRVIRHGVPAHPGSMLWLGRVRRTAVLGLPTCGAYSKATAADLLLPRLLTGEPPTLRTVSHLGHGGILTRSQRFRFPAYAQDLAAPDG
jgi:hypothetical protein